MGPTPGSGELARGYLSTPKSEPMGLVIPAAMASTSRQAQLDHLSGRKCTSYPPTVF